MWLLSLSLALAAPFVEVATTPDHGCARTDAGRVACWSSIEPELRFVEDLDDAVQIVASGTRSMFYACALRADRSVRCWGDGQVPDVEPLKGAHYLIADQESTPLCAGLDEGLRCVFQGRFPWTSGREEREGPIPFQAQGPVQSVMLFGTPPRWCFVEAKGTPACPPLQDDRTGFTAVAATREASCGVRGGQVYCGGSGYEGNLGDGEPNRRAPADSVRVLGPKGVVQLVGGTGNAFCARSGDGAVWCWGSNQEGSLGTGFAGSYLSRGTRVDGLQATDVSLWHKGGCATTTGGGISCWGDAYVAHPRKVPGVGGVQELVAGEDGACARVEDGQVWCWGDLQRSEGDESRRLDNPTVVAEARGWRGLTLKTDGLRWTLCGIEGDDQVACSVRPHGAERAVRRWTLPGVTRVIAPWHASLDLVAVDGEGEVWWWNPADVGELASLGVKGEAVEVDTAGNSGVVMLRADGTLWHRALRGAEPRSLGAVPAGASLLQTRQRHADLLHEGALLRVVGGEVQPVEGAPRGVAAIRGSSTCVLRQDGRVTCDGKLREALDYGYDGPKWVDVPGVSDAVGLAGGRDHACILHRDRSVSCFGSRGRGQLGDGVRVAR